MKIIFNTESKTDIRELANSLAMHIKKDCEDILFNVLTLLSSEGAIKPIYNTQRLTGFCRAIEARSDRAVSASDIYHAVAKVKGMKDTRSLLAQLSFDNPDNEFSIRIPSPGKPNRDVLPLNTDKEHEQYTRDVLNTLKSFTLDPEIEAGATICLSNDMTTADKCWHGHHYIKLSFLGSNEEFRFIVRRDSKTYIKIKQAIDENQESDKYIQAAQKLYPNHVVMQFIEQDHLFTVSKERYDLLKTNPELLSTQHAEMLIAHYRCDRF